MSARLAAHRTALSLVAVLACGDSPSPADESGGASTSASTGPGGTTSDPSAASDGPVPTTGAASVDGSSGSTSEPSSETGSTGDERASALDIYWIDSEGGAATLFVTPEGPLVLVDAGFPGDRDADRIADVVEGELGRDTIDLCIVTHFHVDHVGGVPDLLERVEITEFWDHGDSVETNNQAGQQLWQDYLAVADGRRTVVAPGELRVVGGLELELVAAHAELIDAPLAAGGADNPACAGAVTMAPEGGENPMSVGFVARFGPFDMLDLGDLTWSYEHELACRTNLLGPIDLYQTTHHGQANSGATQLVHAIDPIVVVMNNGPHKGGAPETHDRVIGAPSSPDLWQVHRALDSDDAHNAPADLIANEGEGEDDEGHVIHAHIDESGLITITNRRNDHSRDYAAQ